MGAATVTFEATVDAFEDTADPSDVDLTHMVGLLSLLLVVLGVVVLYRR